MSATTHQDDAGGPAGDDAELDAAAQAVFRFVRHFSRQPIHQRAAADLGRAVALSHIHVAQAVADGQDAPGGSGVGAVAARLGLDPSTASRLAADAIQAGYVEQAAAPRDGRRRTLRLTAAGAELLEHARRHQRAQFDQLTAGWSAAERREFARLFARFAAAELAGED